MNTSVTPRLFSSVSTCSQNFAPSAWPTHRPSTSLFPCIFTPIASIYTVRRAETETGADYYVAPPGMGIEDLEGCFRLESSCINKGNNRAVEHLLFTKVEQTRKGKSNLPAIACVIGFEV